MPSTQSSTTPSGAFASQIYALEGHNAKCPTAPTLQSQPGDGFGMGYQHLPFIRHPKLLYAVDLRCFCFPQHAPSEQQFYTLLIV
jgi:hypothetical protein